MQSIDNAAISLTIDGHYISGAYKVEKIDLAIAEMAVNSRLKLQNGVDYVGIFETSTIKSITKEAREYLSSPISYEGLKAAAFIRKSPIETTIGNMYLKFGAFPVPTRLFRDKEKAMQWVKGLELR